MTAEELKSAIEAQLANYEISLLEASDEEVEEARERMATLLTKKAEAYAKHENEEYIKSFDDFHNENEALKKEVKELEKDNKEWDIENSRLVFENINLKKQVKELEKEVSGYKIANGLMKQALNQ